MFKSPVEATAQEKHQSDMHAIEGKKLSLGKQSGVSQRSV